MILKFCVYQNCLEGLVNHRLLGPSSRVSFRRTGVEPKNLGTDAASLGTLLQEPLIHRILCHHQKGKIRGKDEKIREGFLEDRAQDSH